MTRVVIAGGGTGGHLFPGVAIAEELARRGHVVSFVGTARGIEARVLPREGFELDLVDVAGLKGGGLGGALRGLLRLPRALLQSLAILRLRRPQLVVGVGGYASGPMVATAWLRRVPTAILEQNSVPGLTNRILGRLVRVVFGSFEASRGYFSAATFELLGNPIRARVRAALAVAADARRERAAPPDDRAAMQHKTLLVLGGSQGAHGVNELVVEAALLLGAAGLAPRIVHQTGKADRASVEARYRAAGPVVVAEVREFIDDMASAYAGADLIVARAGASTIAEIAAIGRAAILIPFPRAADDHQTRNAESMTASGAAELLREESTTPRALADAIARLLADDRARATLADRARALGRPDAASAIVDRLLHLARS